MALCVEAGGVRHTHAMRKEVRMCDDEAVLVLSFVACTAIQAMLHLH